MKKSTRRSQEIRSSTCRVGSSVRWIGFWQQRVLLFTVAAASIGGGLRPVRGEVTAWMGHGSNFCDPNDPAEASFFDCSHWSNHPPCCCDTCNTFGEPVCGEECAAECDGDGEADTVILGVDADPDPAHDAPRYLHFGTFCGQLSGLCPGTETVIAAGNARANNIYIEEDDWTFDFGSGATPGCTLPEPSEGSLSVHRFLIGTKEGSDASLSILNGTLHNTFVTHIAPANGASARVEVDGPSSKWIVDGYMDLGWVGSGSVAIRNGAELTTAGAILAGIRDDAFGEIEIMSGGKVSLGSLDVGFGHESTGLGKGRLFVADAGSTLSVAPGWINVGGISSGKAAVRNGGEVLVEGGVVVSGPPAAPSSLVVSDPKSLLETKESLIVARSGGRGALTISARGSASCKQGVVGEEGQGARGEATVTGPRSQWEINEDLRVGSDGDQGSLTVSRGGLVTIGTVLEVGALGTINVLQGGKITVGDCPRRTPANAISICPGGTLIKNGTINARIVEIPTSSPVESDRLIRNSGKYGGKP